MNILGISAFYHDSAACHVQDGKIISAAQEERFTRKKHDSAFPGNAIEFCLKDNNLTAKDLDYVAYYDKPFLTFERILETYLFLGLEIDRSKESYWIKRKSEPFDKSHYERQF